MRVLLALASLALAGCSNEGEPVSSSNKEIKVEKLLTVDGCTVYRFFDAGRHYFVKCEGEDVTRTESRAGKKTTSIDTAVVR